MSSTSHTGVSKQGLLFGTAAYGLWGLLPLYWNLLKNISAVETLAHRFVWSLVVVGVLLGLRRRSGWWRALRERPQAIGLLAVAAAVIALNWFLFIWGVNNERVVETALGYFSNPLVTVLVGVVLFRERLRRAQWLAIGLAAIAVGWLTLNYGQVPWVAIGLAFTFAAYGALKKKAAIGAVESLAIETTVILPFALGYCVWLEVSGAAGFGHAGWDTTLLLIGAGPATAVPLLFFAGAATRIPLTYLGLLQYIAPTATFLLGVFAFGEPMPTERLLGFVIIWLALVIFTVENFYHGRKLRRAALRLAAESNTTHAETPRS